MEPTNAVNDPGRDLEDFIGAMKSEDLRDRKNIRKAKISFALAGAFYAGLFLLTWIAPPDQSPGLYRLVLGSFGLLFLLVAYMNWRKSRELAAIDYTQPTGVFLEGAAKRYRMVNLPDAAFRLFFSVMFIVMGSMGWLAAKDRYFPQMERSTALLIYAGIILLVGILGGNLAVKDWKNRKEPLIRKIQEMRAELDRTETDG
jgi:hypothetical protein